MAKLSVAARVTAALEEISITNTKARRNAEGLLFEVRKWQEAKSYSDKKLKAAWAGLVDAELISADDELRKQHEAGGPYILAEGGAFTVTLKVSSGGTTLDPEALADIISRRFKVTKDRAAKAILDARKPASNKLEKRVLEAGV